MELVACKLNCKPNKLFDDDSQRSPYNVYLQSKLEAHLNQRVVLHVTVRESQTI